MFDDLNTLLQNGLIFALVASFGGCIIRQSSEMRARKSTSLKFLLMDWFIAVFLGFYTFWFVYEEIRPTTANACGINIIVGYLGSRIIEIAKTIFIRRSVQYLKDFKVDKNG